MKTLIVLMLAIASSRSSSAQPILHGVARHYVHATGHAAGAELALAPDFRLVLAGPTTPGGPTTAANPIHAALASPVWQGRGSALPVREIVLRGEAVAYLATVMTSELGLGSGLPGVSAHLPRAAVPGSRRLAMLLSSITPDADVVDFELWAADPRGDVLVLVSLPQAPGTEGSVSILTGLDLQVVPVRVLGGRMAIPLSDIAALVAHTGQLPTRIIVGGRADVLDFGPVGFGVCFKGPDAGEIHAAIFRAPGDAIGSTGLLSAARVAAYLDPARPELVRFGQIDHGARLAEWLADWKAGPDEAWADPLPFFLL